MPKESKPAEVEAEARGIWCIVGQRWSSSFIHKGDPQSLMTVIKLENS